jgi:hypothetical protein
MGRTTRILAHTPAVKRHNVPIADLRSDTDASRVIPPSTEP